MKKITLGLIALAFFSFGMLPAHADESLLDVKISLGQGSVKSGMMFLVAAKVKSQTDTPVNMQCHSCSFEKQWVVDTPDVFIQPWTCHEDRMEKVTVDAIRFYEKNLILYIKKTDESGPVMFRLGFKHILQNGDEMEPVWSNPVTLDVIVTQEMKDAAAKAAQEQAAATVELSESMPDEAMQDSDEGSDPDLDSQTL